MPIELPNKGKRRRSVRRTGQHGIARAEGRQDSGMGVESIGLWGGKDLPRRATHLPLDIKRRPTSFEVVAHASSAHLEHAQVALVDLVGGDLVDVGDGHGTRHDVLRPCGVPGRRSQSGIKNVTPHGMRHISAAAANGQRSGGGCAWQVGGRG